MSDGFRGQLIAAGPELDSTDWAAIIDRGLFLNACTFATQDLGAYPGASRTAFREALGRTAPSLAARALWFDLNPSKPPTDPACTEGVILREALRPRIERIVPRDLEGLDFREAVNGLAFAWRERPDLRPELAGRLWQILPDAEEWPSAEGEIAALRLVLTLARSELIATADAQRLLATAIGFLTPAVCAEIHTLPLFLLLWNLVALAYERGKTRCFDGALPKAVLQTVMDLLRERVKPRAPNKEKLAQLSLGSMVLLVDPGLGRQLAQTLEPIDGATPWLAKEALAPQVGFVPALFTFEGIALLQPRAAVFTPMVRAALLAKSREYDEIGPAIERLRAGLERGGRR
jgi:hypothetical protein